MKTLQKTYTGKYAPNHLEFDYWIDLTADAKGSVIKTYNGMGWTEISGDSGEPIDAYTKAEIDSKLSTAGIKYEFVDLGLPSGVKWASCDVGATSPEGTGDFFAWGEVQPKSEYTVENSKTTGWVLMDISGNPEYDAASANWGSGWRLPTTDNIFELRSKCVWTKTQMNGVTGYNVTGPNGNSIFLPSSGHGAGINAGIVGYRWSSEDHLSDKAYCLLTDPGASNSIQFPKSSGANIRPVTDGDFGFNSRNYYTKNEIDSKFDTLEGSNTLTVAGSNAGTIDNIPVNKPVVRIEVNSSGTFKFRQTPQAGREIHVFILNTSSNAVTITLDRDHTVLLASDSITLNARTWAEICAISDGEYTFIRIFE